MGRYSVVIIPRVDHKDGESGDVPRLTIGVSNDGPEPRVTDIAINTTSPAGLTADSIFDIDVSAIVAALAARFSHTALPPGSMDPPVPGPLGETASAGTQPSGSGSGSHVVAEAGSGSESGRAYRKMPEVSELLATYRQVGTVTGVAKHYGVPRHTAQGWMGRLRKLDQQQDSTPRG